MQAVTRQLIMRNLFVLENTIYNANWSEIMVLMCLCLLFQNAVYNANWGEMVRLRLRYDEAKKQVSTLQEQLAKIEDQMIPGQNESDKDRSV